MEMPVLKNTRHELFAQALAQGKTASEAIGLAGFAPDPSNSSRLTKNEDIRRRVNELLNLRAARQERKADYDSRWVIEELIDNVIKAKEKGDYNASHYVYILLNRLSRLNGNAYEVGRKCLPLSDNLVT